MLGGVNTCARHSVPGHYCGNGRESRKPPRDSNQSPTVCSQAISYMRSKDSRIHQGPTTPHPRSSGLS